MLPLLAQIKFDPTISFGNIIWSFCTLILAVAAWRDLTWRIKNLETWRKEHMVDSDSRDAIITKMDRILYHISNGQEGRLAWIRRDDTRADYHGPERRKKP